MIGSGLSMEEMIFEVADTHLFFNDLEVHSKSFCNTKHYRVCEGRCASHQVLKCNDLPKLNRF